MKNRLGWLLSILIAVVFLLPLGWMIQASFRIESSVFNTGLAEIVSLSGLTLENYTQAWRRGQLSYGLFNSMLQVVIIIGGGLLINSMAAFAFARASFRGRDMLFAGVVLLIILPVEVLVVPMYLTGRDLGLASGGYFPTIALLTLPFMAKAFNIYFLRQHFLAFPHELEEAAIVDGAGVWRIYWNVALPAIRPALITVVVLDMLTHWGDFLWPLMVCTRQESRTVQICLANLFTQPPVQWGDILACACLATLPVILFFAWAGHKIVSSDLQVGIK
jgi:ABC-type glycerol-3-phosphate transport system permease component